MENETFKNNIIPSDSPYQYDSFTPNFNYTSFSDHSKKGIPNSLRVLFTVLLSVLLVASTVILIFTTFIYALSESNNLPDIGSLAGNYLTSFFQSRIPVLLCIILPIIFIVIIILINAKVIRRIFFAIGISCIATAALSFTTALFVYFASGSFPADWQSILIYSKAVFLDLISFYAAIFTVLGAAFLSTYACIIAIKGGKYEKGI